MLINLICNKHLLEINNVLLGIHYTMLLITVSNINERTKKDALPQHSSLAGRHQQATAYISQKFRQEDE